MRRAASDWVAVGFGSLELASKGGNGHEGIQQIWLHMAIS